MNRSLVVCACTIALVLATMSPVAAAPGDVSVGRDIVASSTPMAFAAAPDGHLFVVTDDGVDRYGADGARDRTFARAVPAVDEQWRRVHGLDDGAVVVGTVGTQAAVVRLRADGTRDTDFGDGGRVIVVAPDPSGDSAVDAAGRIVLLLGSTVVRLLPDGETDRSFGTDGDADLDPSGSAGTFSFLDALPDGRTMVSGTQASTTNDAMVERLTATGFVDSTYGENGRALVGIGSRATFVADAVALTDGSVVLSSQTIGVDGTELIRIGPDGRESNRRSPTVRCGPESLRDLAAAPDGSLLARVFTADHKANTFTRLRPDLTVDRTFGTYGSRMLNSEALLGPVVQVAKGRMVALERAGEARFMFIELGTTTTVRTPTGETGYWIVADRGGVFSFGDAPFCGSGFGAGTRHFVGAAASSQPYGYWLVTDTGEVAARGTRSFGSVTMPLNKPALTIAPRPQDDGYWIVAGDGGVFSFGAAVFHGSTGNIRLNQPIVGAAPTPTGNGYWIVARDGGVFSFGDARFFGSTGNIRLNQPIVAMEPTSSGNGYWLVAADGGVFTFGDARFLGSTGAIRLAQPIVGMAATTTGNGYRLVARDGGVFTFGDGPYLGSLPGLAARGVLIAEAAITLIH